MQLRLIVISVTPGTHRISSRCSVVNPQIYFATSELNLQLNKKLIKNTENNSQFIIGTSILSIF